MLTENTGNSFIQICWRFEFVKYHHQVHLKDHFSQVKGLDQKVSC